jgi:hypothetical protein
VPLGQKHSDEVLGMLGVHSVVCGGPNTLLVHYE